MACGGGSEREREGERWERGRRGFAASRPRQEAVRADGNEMLRRVARSARCISPIGLAPPHLGSRSALGRQGKTYLLSSSTVDTPLIKGLSADPTLLHAHVDLNLTPSRAARGIQSRSHAAFFWFSLLLPRRPSQGPSCPRPLFHSLLLLFVWKGNAVNRGCPRKGSPVGAAGQRRVRCRPR